MLFMQANSKILKDIELYYSEKINSFGPTAQGVDWNSGQAQLLRFKQLCKVISNPEKPFSLTDLGCGYGALYSYLENSKYEFKYLGIDISEKMIMQASDIYRNSKNCSFSVGGVPTSPVDYILASGIFNVRLGQGSQDWVDFMISVLDKVSFFSQKGFAFNCLSSYSDKEKMQDYLYYADPNYLFDMCKKKYSKNIALLHDYGLYEFTLIVRK